MKKVLSTLLAVGLVLSLAACGDKPATTTSASTETPTSVSTSVKDEPVSNPTPTPSTDKYVQDFKEAQRLWFLFEGGASSNFEDSKTADLNGYDMEFYRVTEPGFGSLQEMIDTLSTAVDPVFVYDAVNNNQGYREFDGVLYACPAGRGDDMSMAWVEMSSESDGITGKVIVKVHRQDYFDALNDFYETGDIDTYEYPFMVKDGHALFTSMDYLTGSSPEETPRAGYEPDDLESALIGLLVGKWIYKDGASYYQIEADGSFAYYIGDEATDKGVIFSSRSGDGSYQMESENTRGTFFYLTKDLNGVPVLSFDEGGTIYEAEGKG